MSYKMTDNDVKLRLSCVTLGRDTRLMVLNCQAHFKKAKKKLCLISGNLRNLKIDYCNRAFSGIALLYLVLTEVNLIWPRWVWAAEQDMDFTI